MDMPRIEIATPVGTWVAYDLFDAASLIAASADRGEPVTWATSDDWTDHAVTVSLSVMYGVPCMSDAEWSADRSYLD